MSAQKDFILFDDPAPSAARADSFRPLPSATAQLPPPSSFTKHRSPRQSPAFDDGAPPAPDALNDAAGPRRKRQRSDAFAHPPNTTTTSHHAHAPNQRISPPSGSLGAPMHDLSLGDSLPLYDRTASSSALPSPASTAAMSREQQERVKAQIRAELAGVDTRAFKGPLRDILQKQDYTPSHNDMQTSPLSASSDPMQAGVAPSFSLFPDYDIGGSRSRSHSTHNGRATPQENPNAADQDMPPLLSQRPSDMRTKSGNIDQGFGPMSYPPARHSQNILPDWARQSHSTQISREQHSQSSQQRPYMPPPALSQSLLAQRGGPVSMPSTEPALSANYAEPRRPLKRESSGLTVSPQEAFLDYDHVENHLSHSGLGKMPSLFASVPPGLSDAKLAPMRASAGAQTPRMPSQHNVPRARSSTDEAVYAARPVAMTRNDTARPHHYQKRPGPSVHQSPAGRSPYLNQSDGRGSASQESGSQSSLFSPVDSGDTISTDDDEDERPYYPPNMRPSMIRGGPSSLYLNYPVKGDGRSSHSPSMLTRPLLGKERTSSSGSGAWSHVRTEPWALRQAHMNQPRFSDVSASSSDSDDDRYGRRGLQHRQGADYHPRHAAHHQPHPHHAYPPYGRAHPHSTSPHAHSANHDARNAHRPSLGQHQSSSEDMDDTDRYGRRASGRTDERPSRAHVPGALGGYGYIPGSQESGLSVPGGGIARSQDDGSISPSIRSSAQTIDHRGRHEAPAPEISAPPPLLTSRQPSGGAPIPTANANASAVPAALPPPGALAPGSAGVPLRDERMEASGGDESSSTGTNSASGGGNESDYEDGSPDSAASKRSAARKDKGGTTTTTLAAAKALTSVATDGTTKCDYISPITGAECQTAFHRPYDLARHRETIHAREEAGFVRDGKLSLDACVVLGKEVDPKKSTAVVEWKCKECGANFSRKDAMLRHERLRHNAAK